MLDFDLTQTMKAAWRNPIPLLSGDTGLHVPFRQSVKPGKCSPVPVIPSVFLSAFSRKMHVDA
jgi:hypothetical protein